MLIIIKDVPELWLNTANSQCHFEICQINHQQKSFVKYQQ